jgi:hypothetical protein
MTSPSIPLPGYIGTGLVLGRSLVVGADTTADPDLAPDVELPAGSTLLFTPSVDTLIFTSRHDTVYLEPVTAVIDANGNPGTFSGSQPVYLVANVGQLENDQEWYWTVKPTIDGNTKTAFRIDVPANGTAYLTDWQPIPATPPGSTVARGPKGDQGTPGMDGINGANGINTPPGGTPDGYTAMSAAGAVSWQAPPWPAGQWPQPSRAGAAEAGVSSWMDAPRTAVSAMTPYSPANGRLYLFMFRAAASVSVQHVLIAGSGAVAMVGLWLGVYRIEADGSNTLLSQSGDVSAQVTNAPFNVDALLATPAPLVMGGRYRVAVLIGTATTWPSMIAHGPANSGAFTNLSVSVSERYPSAMAGPQYPSGVMPATIPRASISAAVGCWAAILK